MADCPRLRLVSSRDEHPCASAPAAVSGARDDLTAPLVLGMFDALVSGQEPDGADLLRQVQRKAQRLSKSAAVAERLEEQNRRLTEPRKLERKEDDDA